jgi:hypothetical protein
MTFISSPHSSPQPAERQSKITPPCLLQSVARNSVQLFPIASGACSNNFVVECNSQTSDADKQDEDQRPKSPTQPATVYLPEHPTAVKPTPTLTAFVAFLALGTGTLAWMVRSDLRAKAHAEPAGALPGIPDSLQSWARTLGQPAFRPEDVLHVGSSYRHAFMAVRSRPSEDDWKQSMQHFIRQHPGQAWTYDEGGSNLIHLHPALSPRNLPHWWHPIATPECSGALVKNRGGLLLLVNHRLNITLLVTWSE